MNIVILRHGKPKIEAVGRVTASGFGQFVCAYNNAGIDHSHEPLPSLLDQIKQCSVAVCSNLPRSIESANALGVRNIILQDALFRECDMPYANWNFPKLPLMVWTYLFRILQILGFSSNAESFKALRERAYRCAVRLTELAKTHESVVFVGHSYLNWFVSRNLKRLGWHGPSSPGRKYWEFAVYRYHTNQ